ncbi:DUF58 domain-containing protein [Limibacter armeniacum]|uniref:DUF58 domain-containing protein n=1 Tax=Limibacter armeniacum TaxID=466084 RepID=UPI002FE57B72
MIDIFILYRQKQVLTAHRTVNDKMSNGDANTVHISVDSLVDFPVYCTLIDEVPPQLQRRDLTFDFKLEGSQQEQIQYALVPKTRGEYHFGQLRLLVSTSFRLVRRKVSIPQEQVVKVYPSYLKLKKFELIAFHTGHLEGGIKKTRKIGQQKEFDQIKEYVAGDDYRTINWAATARQQNLMVNHYQDEKAQQVYSLIDMGRSMKMPFNGMTLLDYAINATLVLLHIAHKKQDSVGVVSFEKKVNTFLKAGRLSRQMKLVSDQLYHLDTGFHESNMAEMSTLVRKKITHRSLLMLYTNFEHKESLERNLPYLQVLAKRHVLVVVLFENSELNDLLEEEEDTKSALYRKGLIEQFSMDKRLIAKTLNQHGIHAVLTTPENLTVDTLNKYLALKARGVI